MRVMWLRIVPARRGTNRAAGAGMIMKASHSEGNSPVASQSRSDRGHRGVRSQAASSRTAGPPARRPNNSQCKSWLSCKSGLNELLAVRLFRPPASNASVAAAAAAAARYAIAAADMVGAAAGTEAENSRRRKGCVESVTPAAAEPMATWAMAGKGAWARTPRGGFRSGRLRLRACGRKRALIFASTRSRWADAGSSSS